MDDTKPFVWGAILSAPRDREDLLYLMYNLADDLSRAARDQDASWLMDEMLVLRARDLQALYHELVAQGAL